MSTGVAAAILVYVGIPSVFAFIYEFVIPRTVDKWCARRAEYDAYVAHERAYYAARAAKDGGVALLCSHDGARCAHLACPN